MTKNNQSLVKELFPNENEGLLLSDDSGDEGLGKIKEGIVRNKRFSVIISYDEDVPKLNVIPSSWRYGTKLGDEQGDHVIAYCIIVESAANCEGRNIKKIPQLFYEFIEKVIPEYSVIFEDLKNDVEFRLQRDRENRKITTAKLRLAGSESDSAKILLKRNEIELVARYLEDVADKFVEKLNSLEGAAFAKFRKENISDSLRQEVTLNAISSVKEEDGKYQKFYSKIEEGLEKGDDYKTIAANLKDIETPSSIERNKGNKNVRHASVKDFLVEYSPKDRYHEGFAAESLREWSKKIKEDNNITAEEAKEIGQKCAALFDYRYTKKTEADYLQQIEDTKDLPNSSSKKLKVKDGETKEQAAKRYFDDNKDDEEIFYKSAARLIILIFSSFQGLNDLDSSRKNDLYTSFLNRILIDQHWNVCTVEGEDGNKINLNVGVLKQKIGKYAIIDPEHDIIKMRKKFILEDYGKSDEEKINFTLKKWQKDVREKIDITSFDYRSLLKLFKEKKDSLSEDQKQKITAIVFRVIKSQPEEINQDCEKLFSYFVDENIVDSNAVYNNNSLLIWSAFSGFQKTFNSILSKCSEDTLNMVGRDGDVALMWSANCGWYDECCNIIARSTKTSLESKYINEGKEGMVQDFIRDGFEGEESKCLIQLVADRCFLPMKDLVDAINDLHSPGSYVSITDSRRLSPMLASQSRGSSYSNDD